jgi:hypothetical protein
MNKNIYKSAIDNIQFSENLSEKTLDYLCSNILQTQKKATAVKVKNKRLSIALVAAACVLTFLISIPIFHGRSDFELPNSVGNVSVKYINKAPNISAAYSLVSLTEEELFHKYNTDIFMGKIEDIRNIKIKFNSSYEYRAIAKIKVDKVYRGNKKVGETVSALLPCSVNTSVWVEDTEVVSSMRVGMSGIFMPVKYDKTMYREENGAKIYLQDIAEYGFMDGERYAFLNSNNGLIFAKHAYKSIDTVTSLEEIEKYVIKMIQ